MPFATTVIVFGWTLGPSQKSKIIAARKAYHAAKRFFPDQVVELVDTDTERILYVPNFDESRAFLNLDMWDNLNWIAQYRAHPSELQGYFLKLFRTLCQLVPGPQHRFLIL